MIRLEVSEALLDRITIARDVLLDAIGMSTHHDTVTGTCHQVVADDYYYRIDRALKVARKTGAEIAEIKIKEDLGIDVDDFLFCDRSNGTYLNCPTGVFPNKN
jgi:hypothetical protein